MPKVSVIMSFCNDEKYIGEAVKSILEQTFSDFEFIIINDASTDSSEEIVKEFADKRIKLIKNSKNLGLTKSLNIGIREAVGEYIARMDADDVCLPQRFEKQVKFLDGNRRTALVGCWVEFIDPEGKSEGIKKFPTDFQDIKKILISYLPFRHPTLIIRKKALDEVGFYDESFKYAQDYELILRTAKKFPVANLPEVLLKYRNWPPGSISAEYQKQQEFYALKARVKALTNSWYPTWQVIYLIKPAVSFLIPSFIKKPIIKKFIFKS